MPISVIQRTRAILVPSIAEIGEISIVRRQRQLCVGDDVAFKQPNTVIASAAKQSIAPRADRWIASWSLSSGAHSRDPLARNDGRYTFAISPPVFARAIHLLSRPLQSEGAGKAGCALHPRSRVQTCAKNTHTSIQVQRRQSDFPCAVVLTLIFVLSPAIRPGFVTVACAPKRKLDASLEASGPHDFAVRFRRFRQRRHPRPPLPAPRR